ncbi:hypothetical protein CR513_25209, partial [Mucuna pruriens]
MGSDIFLGTETRFEEVEVGLRSISVLWHGTRFEEIETDLSSLARGPDLKRLRSTLDRSQFLGMGTRFKEVEAGLRPISSSISLFFLFTSLSKLAMAGSHNLSSQSFIVRFPPHVGYKWVDEEVLISEPVLSPQSFEKLASNRSWHEKGFANKYLVIPCSLVERVCHSAWEGEESFIYMYRFVLQDLGVTLPFQPFETDVLRSLGIAPSQLHPSSWAALQAFRFLCRSLSFLPSVPLFLYYHTIHPNEKAS